MKALWIILSASVAIYLFAPVFPDSAPDPAAPVAPPAKPGTDSVPVSIPVPVPVMNEVILTRASDGHFYTEAQVNGTPIRFIVDTGATNVALTRADAQKLGLAPADAEFTETAKGAGGPVKFKPVLLDHVSVGSIEARQVQAAVLQSDMPVSLLGQSWLKNVGTVSISQNRMVLR
jgi:aspartyl protease family protein